MKDDQQNTPEGQQIQVQMPQEIQRGVYANQLGVAYTPEEFILDFVLVTPPAGIVNSRVIVSPTHAKRMLATLHEHLSNYEATYGEITLSSAITN